MRIEIIETSRNVFDFGIFDKDNNVVISITGLEGMNFVSGLISGITLFSNKVNDEEVREAKVNWHLIKDK